MLRRRSSRLALICSLIIHLFIAAIMIHLQIEQRQSPFFDNVVLVDIIYFQRPVVRPPKPGPINARQLSQKLIHLPLRIALDLLLNHNYPQKHVQIPKHLL